MISLVGTRLGTRGSLGNWDAIYQGHLWSAVNRFLDHHRAAFQLTLDQNFFFI